MNTESNQKAADEAFESIPDAPGQAAAEPGAAAGMAGTGAAAFMTEETAAGMYGAGQAAAEAEPAAAMPGEPDRNPETVSASEAEPAVAVEPAAEGPAQAEFQDDFDVPAGDMPEDAGSREAEKETPVYPQASVAAESGYMESSAEIPF